MALGRLVEKPQEITTAINTFLAQPQVTPTSALITGYDFLKDEATAVNDTLAQYGIANRTTLINDTWSASDFRAAFFGRATARGLNSLNSHFNHNSFFPNSGGNVFADEVASDSTDYSGALIFSVGCHSGLNVPDRGPGTAQQDTDWAQAFARRGATYLGNTGFGYGDSDLIAYSEKLMVNFVQQLGDAGGGRAHRRRGAAGGQAGLLQQPGYGLVQQLRPEGARRDDALRPADAQGQRAQSAQRDRGDERRNKDRRRGGSAPAGEPAARRPTTPTPAQL